MDFKEILKPEVQEFILQNTEVNLSKFLLKKSPFPYITIQEIAQQIKGRQIAQKKFPFLLKEGIIFPPHLNIEQASSQDTAEYKAQLLQGKNFLDLTCGFGIDAYFLSKNFEEIYLVEQNATLSKIVQHNWGVLGRKAHFVNDNLENFLKNNQQVFDLIYLDPARRDTQNNKKFLLEDLSPNILEIQEKLHSISKKIMIKLSPLIDLKSLQNKVKFISKIEIIGVKNDVKEIIAYITPNFIGKTKIIAQNLNTQESELSFLYDEEVFSKSEFSDILDYVYIPNNSVLKSGAFNLVSQKYNLKKLHPNTHIYTSNEKLPHFCGRIFKVREISTKEIKKGEQSNIISKNYPLSPEQIKKKYKLKDGGDNYLFFTQSIKGKIVLKNI